MYRGVIREISKSQYSGVLTSCGGPFGGPFGQKFAPEFSFINTRTITEAFLKISFFSIMAAIFNPIWPPFSLLWKVPPYNFEVLPPE